MHWDCCVAVPENMRHRTSSLKKLESRILKVCLGSWGLIMKMTVHSRILLFFIIVTSLPCLSLARQQNSADSGDDFPGKVYRQTLVKESTSYQTY